MHFTALFALLLVAAASLVSGFSLYEGVYLVNANDAESGLWFSQLAYYSNATGASQNQQHPDATASVNGSPATWEGQSVCGTYDSGNDMFCTIIDSGAASYATGQYAGWAWNYETNFYCFKDSGRTLYTTTGVVYDSMYYCYDA